MSAKFNSKIAVIGIDIGKNSFHIVGLDRSGAIVAAPPSSVMNTRTSFNHLVGAAKQLCRVLALENLSRIDTASGNERPSSFAVLRLMISSIFVDWETGMGRNWRTRS